MERKIIFIAGHNRGGSTLLTMLLGQQKGYFAAGELKRIWQGGFIDNELCTCGKPIKSCEFWNAVVQDAFGGWNGIDPVEVLNLFNEILLARNYPRLAAPALRSEEFQKKTNTVLDILGKLYSAILKISNTKILVDSSKVSMYGILLNQLSNLDLYTLHLNRHSCGVAYSKQKKRTRDEVHWQTVYMTRHSIYHSANKWMRRNFSAGLMRFTTPCYIRIKYESLAKKPQETITQVVEFINEAPPDLSFFLEKDQVAVKNNHMFGGNPMRFQEKVKKIHPDNEWRSRMTLGQKTAVVFLSWPYLLRDGYFGGEKPSTGQEKF